MKNCNFHHNTFQINQNILVANAMVEQNLSPADVKMKWNSGTSGTTILLSINNKKDNKIVVPDVPLFYFISTI